MTSLLTEAFHFELPEELIAEKPLPHREASRLLVLDRSVKTVEHHRFTDLPKFLTSQDLLVFNNSRVRPSVMHTVDGAIEITLLKETSPRHWRVLGLPGRKLKPGGRYSFAPLPDAEKNVKPITAEVLTTLPSGERVLRFFGDFNPADYAHLQLPPYINKRRRDLAEAGSPVECNDEERYQTVYAEPAGSVAAPTAGLHFTPEMIAQFNHAFITLHVGMGTFRPVKSKRVQDHDMHSEAFTIPEDLREQAKRAERVVAIGTTVCRVLESVPSLKPQVGETDIFIYPPHRFRRVDALLTNFHLPHSTLLMLVCAFAGTEFMLDAYRQAVAEKYRFFSYGDAMLIL
ncbi:MAG: tRNA preQ1(34) S-adenosylmethionine ribosyltransferase-isomerase QueA [Verrucomicrobiota bacterium]